MRIVDPCAGGAFRSTHAYIAIGVSALWIVAAAFWATPAFFTNDDVIYHSMIDAFSRDGSLIVTNGYEEIGSAALRLRLMRIADGHLVPQYPGGWGILAAPAYLASGLRGVMFINAVAGGLTLLMIWISANALFLDRRVAGAAVLIYALSTFAVDYALALSPHSVSTFLVTAAFAAIARGWRMGGADEMRGQFFAGLAIGFAINIRVDAILALGGLVTWQIAVSRRPFLGLLMFAIGLAPGVASSSAINYLKFGTPMPLSYGLSGGKSSMTSYLPPLPFMVLGALALMAVGLYRVRAIIYRPAVQAALLVTSIAIIVAVPPLRTLMLQLINGIYVLVVDFQAHPISEPRQGLMDVRGITMAEDGTVLAYGLAKKALLQSMPYAAVVIVLLPRLVRGPDRAAVSLCLFYILPFIAFFSINTWHGGLSNNMRYFLNFVPVLAILTAVAWYGISASDDGRQARFYALVVWAGGAVILYAVLAADPFAITLQRSIPNILVAGTAAGSVVFLLVQGAFRVQLATVLRALVASGLGVAFISAWALDTQFSEHRRSLNAEMAEITGDLPKNALVVTFAIERAGIRLNRPPALTAQSDFDSNEIDAALVALIKQALADKRPVFAQSIFLANRLVKSGAVSIGRQRYGIEEYRDLYQVFSPPG